MTSAAKRIVLALLFAWSGCGGSSGADDGDGGGPDGGGGDAAPCAPYRSLCGGECIPTSVDPLNCGGCGHECTGGTVCSAGVCADSCLPGLAECGASCVDTRVDNAHCGGCDRPCDPGTGCNQGTCVPSATLGDPPAGACAGGGPPVTVTGTTCAGDLAATSFTWALCSCADITQGTKILTDAYDSAAGPYAPGGLGGSVGANGELLVEETGDAWPSGYTIDVSGTLWTSATPGLTSGSDLIARQELHVGGPVDVQRARVELDAFAAGDVSGNPLVIAGALHQPAGASVNGDVTAGSMVSEVITVPDPCACDGAGLVPVTSIATAHATDNDNALIGLDPGLLVGAAAPQRLDLPCGRYYLSSIDVTRTLSIVAHGRTALYVGGDLHATAKVQLALDPGAELDVFIGGNLSVPAIDIGSPNYPALSRTYVGGNQRISVSDNTSVAGNFYAASAQIAWQSPTEAYGAVFAGRFEGLSEVQIHYDQAVLDGSCPTTDPDACTSCLDCGNQACIDGACGACRTSADCCAPLLCEGGVCKNHVGID